MKSIAKWSKPQPIFVQLKGQGRKDQIFLMADSVCDNEDGLILFKYREQIIGQFVVEELAAWSIDGNELHTWS